MAHAVLDGRVEELGGPGWRVREQTHVTDTVDPWPAPVPAPKRRTAWRRAATAGITLVLFCASGVAAIALSPSKTSTHAGPSAVAPRATAQPATRPLLSRQPVIPAPAQVKLAARDYAGAVAPLNKALDDFDVALHMANSQPCKCPQGAFDGGGAVQQIPGILTAFSAVQGTLQHMKTTEVPAFGASIDAATNAYAQQMASVSAVYQAYQGADTAGVETNIEALHSEEASARPVLAALQAALTLGVGPTL